MKYLSIHQLLVTKARSVLTLHRHPDLDSIGSNLALAHILTKLGHEVTLYSNDEIPEDFLFLPGAQDILILPAAEIPWNTFDVYWALDMAEIDRMGATQHPSGLHTVVIDHHDTNEGWGTVNIVERDQAATATILLHIMNDLHIEIDEVTAQCLLTGIAGDTGFFKYAVTPEILADAAFLIEHGADYDMLTNRILNQMDFADLQFTAAVLQRAKLYPEKKCMLISIPNDIWKDLGKGGTKDIYIVKYLAEIKDTLFGGLLIEEEPGNIRVRFRSHDSQYNVAELAQKFGGGGHTRASGAQVLGKGLEELIEEILEAV